MANSFNVTIVESSPLVVTVEETTNSISVSGVPSLELVVGVPPVGPQGIQGIQGVQGPAGDGALLVQTTPSLVWLFPHNLGYYPNVTVLSEDDEVIVGFRLLHSTVNMSVLTWMIPTTGKAYAS